MITGFTCCRYQLKSACCVAKLKSLLSSETSDCYELMHTCCTPKLIFLLVSEKSDCHKHMTRCCVRKLKLSLLSKHSNYDSLMRAQVEFVAVEAKS